MHESGQLPSNHVCKMFQTPITKEDKKFVNQGLSSQ